MPSPLAGERDTVQDAEHASLERSPPQSLWAGGLEREGAVARPPPRRRPAPWYKPWRGVRHGPSAPRGRDAQLRHQGLAGRGRLGLDVGPAGQEPGRISSRAGARHPAGAARMKLISWNVNGLRAAWKKG